MGLGVIALTVALLAVQAGVIKVYYDGKLAAQRRGAQVAPPRLHRLAGVDLRGGNVCRTPDSRCAGVCTPPPPGTSSPAAAPAAWPPTPCAGLAQVSAGNITAASTCAATGELSDCDPAKSPRIEVGAAGPLLVVVQCSVLCCWQDGSATGAPASPVCSIRHLSLPAGTARGCSHLPLPQLPEPRG